MEEKKIRVGCSLSEAVHKRLRVAAARAGQTIGEYLEALVESATKGQR